MEPAVVQPVIDSAGVRYGVLGIVAALLVVAVVWLWRYGVKREDQIAAERKAVHESELARVKAEGEIAKAATERDRTRDEAHRAAIAQLKVEHERELREASDKYADALTSAVREARDELARVRTESAGTIQSMAKGFAESSEKNAVAFEKLADRIIPRRDYTGGGRGGYGPGPGGGQ